MAEGRVIYAALIWILEENHLIVYQSLAVADSITKLTIVCMTCGKPAIFTHILWMETSKYDDPLILIGAKGLRSKIRKCHEIDK